MTTINPRTVVATADQVLLGSLQLQLPFDLGSIGKLPVLFLSSGNLDMDGGVTNGGRFVIPFDCQAIKVTGNIITAPTTAVTVTLKKNGTSVGTYSVSTVAGPRVVDMISLLGNDSIENFSAGDYVDWDCGANSTAAAACSAVMVCLPR